MISTSGAARARLQAGHGDHAVRTRLVVEASEIEHAVPEWRRLLERSRCSRAFASPSWFGAWCGSDPALRPHLWLAWRDGRLAAALPLVRGPDGPAAFFPGNLSDTNDIVAAAGDLDAATAVLNAALRDPGERLVLSCLQSDSLVVAAAARLGFDVGPVGQGVGPGADVCPFADLSHGYDHYLAGRSASFRYALNRSRRRARSAGLDCGELGPDALKPAALAEEFLRVHRARFTTSCFDPPVARRFLLAALPELFADRRLRVFALRRGDRILAMQLHMQGAESLGYWNGGFVAQAARYAPGRLLLATALRQACREGLAELDLLRGDEPYKKSWASSSRPIGGLELVGGGGSDP